MHELQKNYGHITDGNYGVLHHFYDYVYGIIRRATLTFFGPYRRTIAYHPQGDGMVERFNRSLLQLFRCYVDLEDDWEH